MIAWWQGRTRREQGLLGFLALMVAVVGIWYGVVNPLRAYGDAAHARRLVAEVRLQRIQGIHAARSASSSLAEARQGLEQAARQVSVNPQMGRAEDGGLAFELARVPRQAGLSWLAAVDAQGVPVNSLSIMPHDDGTLTLKGSIDAQ